MDNIEPLIIVGCHRSGTSLLSKMCRFAGYSLGNELNDHYESITFLRHNDYVLASIGCRWDYVHPILQNESMLQEQMNIPFDDFIEPNNRYWGWKDPRTTVLLPYWLQAFPQAKVLFIIRNCVSVSNSLVKREKNRLFGDPEASSRCATFEGAFQLWKDYNSIFFLHKKRLKANVLTIRYEDLVDKPSRVFYEIAQFTGKNLSLKERLLLPYFISSAKNKEIKNHHISDSLTEYYMDPIIRKFYPEL
jgi:hypothetical protein